MSRERFEWLSKIAGEVITTPGSESNVKEIFDKCHELSRTRGDDIVIFNQFEEFGNYLWHYEVTGAAIDRLMRVVLSGTGRLKGFVSSTGSAGTIAAGDYLKQVRPGVKIAAAEALQCPTLLRNGYGAHRIEGIGDKHVPWIHNVRNTDAVAAVDDADCMGLLRLFNEPAGHALLSELGMTADFIDRLPLLGISGIGNVLASIKLAKWYELGEQDVVVTILTDSMEMYGSRVRELAQRDGALDRAEALAIYRESLAGQRTDNFLELTHPERKRVHNLKYYTWVEQQGKSVDELTAQWEDEGYWTAIQSQAPRIDELIREFNREVGAGEMKISYQCVTCGRHLDSEEVVYECPRCRAQRVEGQPQEGYPRGYLSVVFTPRAGSSAGERRRPGALPAPSSGEPPVYPVGNTPLMVPAAAAGNDRLRRPVPQERYSQSIRVPEGPCLAPGGGAGAGAGGEEDRTGLHRECGRLHGMRRRGVRPGDHPVRAGGRPEGQAAAVPPVRRAGGAGGRHV